MPEFTIFVISWTGTHERAAVVADALLAGGHEVRIVFSDVDPDAAPVTEAETIRRPNALYWGDKFKACLDNTTAEHMLVIHADCETDDWSTLAAKCLATMRASGRIGVWTPMIAGTPYDLHLTRLADLDGTSLSVVSETDALVFCLSRPVRERMRNLDYEANIHGWGINSVFCAFCLSENHLAVVDRSVRVVHDQGTGYDPDLALRQRSAFLAEMTAREKIMFNLMRTHVGYNHLKDGG